MANRIRWCASFLLLGFSLSCHAFAGTTLRVPDDHKSIQAAMDAAAPGDTVLAAAGTYRERVRMKAGVILRSAGDNTRGTLGLRRAEATIVDGGGRDGAGPGVLMAEGSTLDGFTVTNVGMYDEAEWNKHHATQGNEQPHEHIGQPGTAGIGVVGVTCTIINNIVHHIGYTGIAIHGVEGRRCAPLVLENVCYRNMGGGIGSMQNSAAIIEGNVCFQNFYAGIGHEGASPVVIRNVCYENIRAGIGISEGASPVVRNNKCFRNRRAGIGIRTGAETSPIVEENECYRNDMAGIGCEEKCTPVVRNNQCYENALAGIGCRDEARPSILGNRCYRNKAVGIGSEDGARPLIAHNECYENALAGIGQRDGAQTTLIGNHVHHNKGAGLGFEQCESGRSDVLNNRVVDNEKVAVGIHAGWKVNLSGNQLSRPEGLPPVVMVFKGAQAQFSENLIRGSGVAGIRTEGSILVADNKFECSALREAGPPQFAVWGLPGATIDFSRNRVSGWRHAIYADSSTVTACHNQIAGYGQVGIKIEKPTTAVVAVGNVFQSKSDREGILVSGGRAIVANNRIVSPESAQDSADKR